MFQFGQITRRRRPSLTPMIDVVFLLLVFFMLTAQLGRNVSLPLQMAGGEADYDSPPRLVAVAPQALTVNGISVAQDDLIARLQGLTVAPENLIVLRPTDGTSLQRLIDIADLLQTAGFSRLAIVE